MSTKESTRRGQPSGQAKMVRVISDPSSISNHPDDFKDFSSIPIHDDQLHGAAVLARSVIDCQLAVEEMKDLVIGYRKCFVELWQLTKCLGDILIRLEEREGERAWIDRRIKAAEREAARIRLPIWFWRKPEGTVREALRTRATWMQEERYLEDDMFDLLREYLDFIEEDRVTDAQIVALIRWNGGEHGGHSS